MTDGATPSGDRDTPVHRFDVFGKTVGVRRENGAWVAVLIGEEGKHREGRGIVIPPWVSEDGLLRFLADLYHEGATPERPDVVYLGSSEDEGEEEGP